jgi:hypothetical protein
MARDQSAAVATALRYGPIDQDLDTVTAGR